MALGTSERLNMFERIKSACTQKEKVQVSFYISKRKTHWLFSFQILNKAIEDELSLNEEINFRAYRVNLLCDIGDWESKLVRLYY
jgi:hypothetical protein